jgi:hypothetical protein
MAKNRGRTKTRITSFITFFRQKNPDRIQEDIEFEMGAPNGAVKNKLLAEGCIPFLSTQ